MEGLKTGQELEKSISTTKLLLFKALKETSEWCRGGQSSVMQLLTSKHRKRLLPLLRHHVWQLRLLIAQLRSDEPPAQPCTPLMDRVYLPPMDRLFGSDLDRLRVLAVDFRLEENTVCSELPTELPEKHVARQLWHMPLPDLAAETWADSKLYDDQLLRDAGLYLTARLLVELRRIPVALRSCVHNAVVERTEGQRGRTRLAGEQLRWLRGGLQVLKKIVDPLFVRLPERVELQLDLGKRFVIA